MASDTEALQACELCGASIYPEHVTKGIAGRWAGKLLCMHCLGEKKSGTGSGMNPSSGSMAGSPAIQLSEDGPTHGATSAPKMSGFTGTAGGFNFQRPMLGDSANATRCKMFHCKLADGPLAYMADQINEWIDGQADVQIKFATQTVGVVEGKHNDPHLIVILYY